jgi:hypothetical protein
MVMTEIVGGARNAGFSFASATYVGKSSGELITALVTIGINERNSSLAKPAGAN